MLSYRRAVLGFGLETYLFSFGRYEFCILARRKQDAVVV